MILSIDGRVPENGSHAARILRSYQRGEKIHLKVMRQKKTLELDGIVAGSPAHRSGAPGPEPTVATAGRWRTCHRTHTSSRYGLDAAGARAHGMSCYHAPVLLSDFAYDLPAELIAQAPLPERSASRLLVLDPQSGPQDRSMRDFPSLLDPGDLLVFNDTRVIAARVMGTKPTGGRVEIFLERILADGTALVQLRAGKPIRPGVDITTPGGAVRVLGQQQDLWQVRTPGAALEFFEAHGAVPLPPYIQRAASSEDRERYQSIFARDPGAVAAPTASLHFDADLVAALERARRAACLRHACTWEREPSSRFAIRTWSGTCCTRSAWWCRPTACAAIADDAPARGPGHRRRARRWCAPWRAAARCPGPAIRACSSAQVFASRSSMAC